MKGPLFYAKILLFGEYGIIKDAKGLSIPYNFYKGALKISDTKNDEAQTSNQKFDTHPFLFLFVTKLLTICSFFFETLKGSWTYGEQNRK